MLGDWKAKAGGPNAGLYLIVVKGVVSQHSPTKKDRCRESPTDMAAAGGSRGLSKHIMKAEAAADAAEEEVEQATRGELEWDLLVSAKVVGRYLRVVLSAILTISYAVDTAVKFPDKPDSGLPRLLIFLVLGIVLSSASKRWWPDKVASFGAAMMLCLGGAATVPLFLDESKLLGAVVFAFGVCLIALGAGLQLGKRWGVAGLLIMSLVGLLSVIRQIYACIILSAALWVFIWLTAQAALWSLFLAMAIAVVRQKTELGLGTQQERPGRGRRRRPGGWW